MDYKCNVVGNDQPTSRLDITADLGLPAKVLLKVNFSVSGRDYTSYELFDHLGASMGSRRFQYGMGMHHDLAEDLNVLLEEFGLRVRQSDLHKLCGDAHAFCDARYGIGIPGGDVIATFY